MRIINDHNFNAIQYYVHGEGLDIDNDTVWDIIERCWLTDLQGTESDYIEWLNDYPELVAEKIASEQEELL